MDNIKSKDTHQNDDTEMRIILVIHEATDEDLGDFLAAELSILFTFNEVKFDEGRIFVDVVRRGIYKKDMDKLFIDVSRLMPQRAIVATARIWRNNNNGDEVYMYKSILGKLSCEKAVGEFDDEGNFITKEYEPSTFDV